jgi:hypothetical protein
MSLQKKPLTTGKVSLIFVPFTLAPVRNVNISRGAEILGD